MNALLADVLHIDSFIDLQTLKQPLAFPKFSLGQLAVAEPLPNPQMYIPQVLTGLQKLLPKAKEKYAHGLVGVNFNVRDVRQDGIPDTDTPLEDIIRHVDYLVKRLGIQHVALGTDYDGTMIHRS